jgi:hypothetical protein
LQRKNLKGISQRHLRKSDPQNFSGTIAVLLIALKFYFQTLFLVKSPTYVHCIICVHKNNNEIKKKLKQSHAI